MPIELGALDRLNVLWRHMETKLRARNAMVQGASLTQRLEARADTRTSEHLQALNRSIDAGTAMQINTYNDWRQTFAQKTAFISESEWRNVFGPGGDMDWIVRQAFVHNPTLKIDLVLSAGRSRLKSVEAVAGNDVNVLWTA